MLIGSFLSILFAILVSYGIFSSVHTIDEGYVGVVFIFGSLSENILDPGLHFTMPFISYVSEVQVTIQTDYVRNVPCGTNSGVIIIFDKIEVVNQLAKSHVYEIVKNYTVDYDKTLIFDKITHEMNQFCSKHSLQEVYIDEFDKLDEILMDTLQKSLNIYAQGVSIRNIRMSKPTVPIEVENNYKSIVVYQTEMLKAKTQQQKDLQIIATDNEKALNKLESEKEQTLAKINSEQMKKLAEIEANKNHELAETEAMREKEIARIKANEQQKIAEINMNIAINQKTLEKDISYKRGQLETQTIENEYYKTKKTVEIDIEHYNNMKHAEYMNKLMTKEYATVEVARSIAQNSKIYYGDKLPQFFGFGNTGFFNMTL